MSAADDGRGAGAIVIRGAREHNLADLSLEIPKNEITVFTGVSGSGKSSLVFATIAVESQRQLNETFPGYARYRLPRHERPEFDRLENLSATIVVDQQPPGRSARSTVGTLTDASPILRILFSRLGEPSAGESTAYSFNDPRGMCPECEGLGRTRELDLGALIDESRSLNEGALRFPSLRPRSVEWQFYGESGLFDPDLPLGEFSAADREKLLYGEGFKVPRRTRTGTVENEYQGVVRRLERLYLAKEPAELTAKDRAALEVVAPARPCPLCGGTRLNAAALASRIEDLNIADLTALEVAEAIPFLERRRDEVGAAVAGPALAILRRIEAIGLGYLSLDRESPTLSGGEAQRLKTVRFLGSSLTGMTYVFDEPSIGLHPRDVERLKHLLRELRDKGNTVLVVEHDRDVIAAADHVVDMGPGPGAAGGEVVYAGTPGGLREADTTTGRALRRAGRLTGRDREPRGWLELEVDDLHNLHGVEVRIPTGVLTVVTGVAGAGKSSLISDALPRLHPEVVLVDQSAVGLSARSIPATYVDVMDGLRRAFASASGAKPALFSFNSAGACPECRGRGTIRTDLAFLDAVTVTCERCGGSRYNDETLSHRLRGRTIAEVLAMTATEAVGFLGPEPELAARLGRLVDVGLGYLGLGRPLGSLSGGERQRLKLADRLADDGAETYVFDEPTIGLHMADVETLLGVLDRLIDGGGTVIAVEHDLDVIEHADWVIDVGPEAGRGGGRIVFSGRPGELLEDRSSHTAAALREDLGRAAA